MSSHIEELQALLANRTDKYNKLEQHSIECDVELATITDMVLGEDAVDRSSAALFRAIRTLVNSHKRQVYKIDKLEKEVQMLINVKEIKYVD